MTQDDPRHRVQCWSRDFLTGTAAVHGKDVVFSSSAFYQPSHQVTKILSFFNLLSLCFTLARHVQYWYVFDLYEYVGKIGS